ncbi:ribonuclease P protein component [Luteococcus sp. H138]|uniref:ribonuclease P protein component n=1 Tax=unclassified Luteococcus TaxID=2639923 RepID=UPI00313BF45A
MLPAQARMRHASDFRATMRGGARAARPTLVVHATTTNSPPSRVGFVVSKAVGNAVTRNRVKRRLRHLVLPLLADSPGVFVVVRALPAAATSPDRLAEDLAQAWAKCLNRLDVTSGKGAGRSAAIGCDASSGENGQDAEPKGTP